MARKKKSDFVDSMEEGKPKRGRKKIEKSRTPKAPTKKAVIDAVIGSEGNVSEVKRRLGLGSWETAKKHIDKYPEAVALLKDEEMENLDLAEKQLRQKIKEGDMGAIKYLLSTKGKKRGYVEKTEVEHSGELKSLVTTITVGGIKIQRE